MEHTSGTLMALSPLDGRYHEQVGVLRPFFSEYGLIRYRVKIEILWLQYLAQQEEITEVDISQDGHHYLNTMLSDFSQQHAGMIKELEKTTHHDIKAVEYFIRQSIAGHPQLDSVKEFVHFACTSEDINNIAYALMIKDALQEVLLPQYTTLIEIITDKARAYANVPMLARTHGQPASPTTLGKELRIFSVRLMRQKEHIAQTQLYAKLNGASGNFNAHFIAYEEIDWQHLSKQFIESLGLQYNPLTTQIEPHDYIAEICHAMARFNNILLDFCRDIWGYIAWGYFNQRTSADEVGSSTMPHKINPIDFENAEGNLGLSNALFEHFAAKLSISRWQRDLSDSTVLRNLGSGFGYTLLACRSIQRGLGKLDIDPIVIAADLEQHWEVLAEAIQTVMRRYNLVDPYAQLKQLVRGRQALNKEDIHHFIDSLDIPESDKKRLRKLTPATYTGIAEKLARDI